LTAKDKWRMANVRLQMPDEKANAYTCRQYYLQT